MANVTIDSFSPTAMSSVTASHYFILDDGNSTTKLQALAAAIQTITTLGAGGASVLKTFSLGTLAQRDIVGGTGITVTQNTNDITLSVTQGDININNIAGTSSYELSNFANSTSGFLTNVNLASNVTGTLPIANGGTGRTSFTANSVLLGGASVGTAVLDADKEILVGTSSGPQMKTLTAGSSISITQDNAAHTLTVGFTKGNYIEQNDNVTLGDVTVGELTVGGLNASSSVAVTQPTSLATGVTANALAGSITLFTGIITATTNTQFTVTNNTVTASSVIFLSTELQSNVAASNGIHISLASITNGSFVINITNTGNQDAAAITRKIHFFVFG